MLNNHCNAYGEMGGVCNLGTGIVDIQGLKVNYVIAELGQWLAGWTGDEVLCVSVGICDYMCMCECVIACMTTCVSIYSTIVVYIRIRMSTLVFV